MYVYLSLSENTVACIYHVEISFFAALSNLWFTLGPQRHKERRLVLRPV